MRKNILFLSLLLLLSLVSGSCKRISNKNESKEVILASFTVLADIIRNVAKDEFIVRSITKPGVEVHGYQPTPSDLVSASNACLLYTSPSPRDTVTSRMPSSA